MSLQHISHCLNNSPTKAGYSFTKQSRFLPRLGTQSHDLNYNPNALAASPHRNGRSTSFGFGKKLELSKRQAAPSPMRYNVTRDFDAFNKTSSLKRGISFGVSREKFAFLDPLECSKKRIPGPGEYRMDVSSLDRRNGIICNRKPSIFGNKTEVPGPGTYEMEKTFLCASGSFQLSKFRNPESPSFRFKTENPTPLRLRRQEQNSRVGPGSYNDFQPMNPDGAYFLTRYRNNKGRPFGRQKRKGIIDQKEQKNTPGPGLYQHFSVFGEPR